MQILTQYNIIICEIDLSRGFKDVRGIFRKYFKNFNLEINGRGLFENIITKWAQRSLTEEIFKPKGAAIMD